MGKLASLIRGLSGLQRLIAAVVLMGAVGGASYGAYASSTGADNSLLAEGDERLPVQRGALVSQVSTNGTLVFPTRAALTFGVQGTVEELMVTEGDSVPVDAPLAKLDAATIANLEKTAAQAQVALRTAQDALNAVQNPSALALRQAEAAVANAELALRNAKDALATAQSTPSAADVTKARNGLEAAKMAVSNAERDLKLTRSRQVEALQTASEALATASANYNGTFEKWLGITITGGQLEQSPETLLAQWSVNLEQLFTPSNRFDDFNTAQRSSGPSADDPSTPWSETVLYTWRNFYPGAILPTCPDGVVPQQATCVQRDFDTAWAAQLAAIEAFNTAEAKQANDVLTAENKVATTQDALITAQDKLDKALAGPDQLDIAAKEKQVAVAEETLAKAKSDLAAIETPDALDVALKQADLETARRTLETALARLSASTLKSPMRGIVSQVNVAVGDTVNANTLIVEVVDPTVAELSGVVDEIDVLQISQGMQAVVRLDALRGIPLPGTVAVVSASAQNQQGVVTYPIQIRVQAPPQVTLREGLSATADIVLEEVPDVLLIPTQAIFGSFDEPVVRVVANNKVTERPVVLGSTDGFWTVVEEGLNEGDEIVVDRSATFQQLPQQNALRDIQRSLRSSGGFSGGQQFRGQGGQGPGGQGGAGGAGRGS